MEAGVGLACVSALVTALTGSGQLCLAELGNMLNCFQLFSWRACLVGLCWGNVTGLESSAMHSGTCAVEERGGISVLGGGGQSYGHTAHSTQHRWGRHRSSLCQHVPACSSFPKPPSSREQGLAGEDLPIRPVPTVPWEAHSSVIR